MPPLFRLTSTANSQNCPCLPGWPHCLIMLPIPFPPDIIHSLLVNVKRSLLFSHMLFLLPEMPNLHIFFYVQLKYSFQVPLLSKNLSFLNLLQNKFCDYSLFEDKKKALGSMELSLGHTQGIRARISASPPVLPSSVSLHRSVNNYNGRPFVVTFPFP